MIGTSDQSCWLAEACKILLSLKRRKGEELQEEDTVGDTELQAEAS